MMNMFEMGDSLKIGLGLTAGGLMFLSLGVVMFLDRALLAMGNIMFLTGITFIIGFQKTFNLFFQWKKVKGSVTFFLGIFLVLYGWTFIGLLTEVFGFINLFGDFFPYALAFIAKIPVVGAFLCGLPGIKEITERVAPGGVPKPPV